NFTTTRTPDVQLDYAYTADGWRVRKTRTLAGNAAQSTHTVDVFDSLRLEDTSWNGDDYDRTKETAFLGGVARVVRFPAAPVEDGKKTRVFFE
ncbi:hypothetical protein ABTM16_18890, partial [Acinetobacter baumannii]